MLNSNLFLYCTYCTSGSLQLPEFYYNIAEDLSAETRHGTCKSKVTALQSALLEEASTLYN